MEKQRKKKDKKKASSKSKKEKRENKVVDTSNRELLLENIDEDIELNASNLKKDSDNNRSYTKNEVVPVPKPPPKMPFSPHNNGAKKYNFANDLIAENNREE